MKSFERKYLLIKPFHMYLHNHAGELVNNAIKNLDHRAEILDVGGRKSHYTTGINANITISDIPRESETQKELHLGINDSITNQTLNRRSNIKEIIYDDMSYTKIGENKYDCVISVEVIEHVEEDDLFVKNIAKVLKPGGTAILTTPNGDYKPVSNNKDHKRHYKREQLKNLLSKYFSEVDVYYGVKDSKWRKRGLKSWSLTKPVQTLLSMLGNYFNNIESADPQVREQAIGTHHLFAVAKK